MALRHRVGWDAQFCQRSQWFWPLSAAAAQFADFSDWPGLSEFDRVYAELTGDTAPLRFRENVRKQDKRAEGRVVLSALYDARISQAGEVPTRERDWHDLLNMLCFTTFPRSKRALHARQYACLAQRIQPDMKRLPNTRTTEQDALTLFDEGGVVLALEHAEALQLRAASDAERDTLCLALSEARKLRVVPFGHALFEHLVEGLRCPGGCTQIIEVPELWPHDPQFLNSLDQALSEHIAEPSNFTSPRTCGQIRLSTFEL